MSEAVNDALEGTGIVEKTSPEEKDRQQLARAVVRFDKRFDITLDKDSSVITVSFAHRDASLAAQTLDTLLKLYAEKRRTVYMEPRTELAGTEKEISRERVAKSEQALQSFKRQYHVHSFEDERKELLVQRDKAMEQASLVLSAGLNDRIADYNRQLERLDFLERDYQLLQKDVTMANDAYALYSRKFDEAVAMENIGRKRLDSVRIVQNPTIPAEPSHIRAWILLAGAFLGLMSLFFTVSFTRFMRNSFFTMEEVEQETELKVITSFTESDDMEHESMQRLIDSLSIAAGKDKNRIVTFISARSGEGASHVSWNYAMKLAEETGRKVLLIDAGKHSAARMQEYGYIPGNGIIDAYIENKPADETLREIGKGLFVCRFIRAEKNHARAGEVISENDFWKALMEITPHIVIDAPPLQSSHDGVLLAAKSGTTVVVIEAEKTPAEAVNNLYAKLKVAGAKVTGAVVNKRHYHIPDRIYKAL